MKEGKGETENCRRTETMTGHGAWGQRSRARPTCMFLRSWKISMVLRTMSWTVSWPMRHSEAVLTSRAACACCCCCCCCCGGGCAPKGDTSGGVVMETEGECEAGEGLGPGEVPRQAIPHQHTLYMPSFSVWQQEKRNMKEIQDEE